jgi:hypothetical protein
MMRCWRGEHAKASAALLDLIAVEEANDYRTESTIWFPQLAASCQIILGEPLTMSAMSREMARRGWS